MKRVALILSLLFVVIGYHEVQAVPHVITSPHQVVKTISRQEVVWIFTMRTRFWADGGKITVLYQNPAGKTHQEFCSQVLDMSPTRFQQVVSLYINSGNASYFKQVADDNAVIDIVSRVEGAIGYINAELVAVKRGGQDVEILRIID